MFGLGLPKPNTPEELLFICERELSAGQPNRAAEIAKKFVERSERAHLRRSEEYILAHGTTHFVLMKVGHYLLKRDSSNTRDCLVLIFSMHKLCRYYLQQHLMDDRFTWNTSSKYYKMIEESDRIYQNAYALAGEEVASEADLYANSVTKIK